MSSQKGNTKRSRPQKYQNHFAFKNDLHDTSHRTKRINSIQIVNVCERCKKIIEWKIKYKKYKPLKAAGKCNKCQQKTIKHAYHSMCGPCARERRVCPKCGDSNELVEAAAPSQEEQLKLDLEMQKMLKALPERKRRTFIRYMNKQTKEEKNSENGEEGDERLMDKLRSELKSLVVDKDVDNDNVDSDSNSEDCDSDDDSESTE